MLTPSDSRDFSESINPENKQDEGGIESLRPPMYHIVGFITLTQKEDAMLPSLRSHKEYISFVDKHIQSVLMTSLKRPIMAAEKRPEMARRIPHLDVLNPASFPHLQSTLSSSPEVCNYLHREY